MKGKRGGCHERQANKGVVMRGLTFGHKSINSLWQTDCLQLAVLKLRVSEVVVDERKKGRQGDRECAV
tara:strand:+ start:9009 stop:9212 length:204 start_codon:yes stop_codon:yes gene_type:complete